MKKLILATAFAMFGTIAVSAQTTQTTTVDTARPDTTKNKDMRTDNMNTGTTGTINNGNTDGTLNTTKDWDKSKTDTTALKNKDATTGDRKMKKKNK